MALNIRNDETQRLATELARALGTTKTEAVTQALRQRLASVRRQQSALPLAEELDEIALYCASLLVRDDRGADDILDYDERGLPS